jgi:hypothetical protein
MTTVVLAQNPERSPRLTARLTGVFWLLTILTGTVALVAGGQLGISVNLLSTACYATATVFVYFLLKPVNRNLSLLAMFFSLVGCALGTLSALFPLGTKAPTVAFIFFGLHCFLVGYLILRSTFLPRAVGALMVFGGLGWLTFSLSSLLSPPLARSLSPYIMLPGILGEATLTFWLLVKGVNVQRWSEQASASRETREKTMTSGLQSITAHSPQH